MFNRLRAFWRALDIVEWPCEYCHTVNETSMLVWPSVRYQLICRECTNMQNYPAYIKALDPLPSALERTRRRAVVEARDHASL